MLGAVRAEERCPNPVLKPQPGYSPRSPGGAGSQKSLRAAQWGPETPSLHAPTPGFLLVVRAVPSPRAVTRAPPLSLRLHPGRLLTWPPAARQRRGDPEVPRAEHSHDQAPTPHGLGKLPARPSQALSSCYAASYRPAGKVGGEERSGQGWRRRYRVERGGGAESEEGSVRRLCVWRRWGVLPLQYFPLKGS